MTLKRSTVQPLLILIYSTVFLNAVGYTMILQIIFKFVHEVSYGGLYFTAIALGLGSLGVVGGGFFSGWVSDRFGRKNALMLCTLLTTISFIIMAVAIQLKQFELLIIGNVINGIASTNQSITQTLVSDISQHASKQCSVRMSFDTLARVLAMIAGPFLGQCLSNPHLVSWFNLTTPFLAGAIFAGCALLAVLVWLPGDGMTQIKVIPIAFKLHTPLLLLFTISFLIQLADSQYLQYVYPFLDKLHFSWNERALLLSLNGIYVGFALFVIYPLLASRVALNKIMRAALLFLIAGMIMLLMPTSKLIWVANLIWSLGIALYFPPLLTYLGEWVGYQNRGKVYCWNMALIGFAWFITGFTSIWLSRYGVRVPLLLSWAVICVAGILYQLSEGMLSLQKTSQALS